MMHTLQLMSADKQQEINQAHSRGEVDVKESKSGIKYLVWK